MLVFCQDIVGFIATKIMVYFMLVWAPLPYLPYVLCNEHAKALTCIVSGAPQLTLRGPEAVEQYYCLKIE